MRPNERREGMPSGPEAGFSLVELLIAMTLVGTLGLLVATVFFQGYGQGQRLIDEFDLRSAGLTVLREIRTGFEGHGGLMQARTIHFLQVDESLNESETGEPALIYTYPLFGKTTTIAYRWDRPSGTMWRGLLADGIPWAQAARPVLAHVEEFRVCRPGEGDRLDVSLVLDSDRRRPRRVELGVEVYPRNLAFQGSANEPMECDPA